MNFMAGWDLGGMWVWWLFGLALAVAIIWLIGQLMDRTPRSH